MVTLPADLYDLDPAGALVRPSVGWALAARKLACPLVRQLVGRRIQRRFAGLLAAADCACNYWSGLRQNYKMQPSWRPRLLTSVSTCRG